MFKEKFPGGKNGRDQERDWMLTFGKQQNMESTTSVGQVVQCKMREEIAPRCYKSSVDYLYKTSHGGSVCQEADEVEGVDQGGTGNVETYNHTHDTC